MFRLPGISPQNTPVYKICAYTLIQSEGLCLLVGFVVMVSLIQFPSLKVYGVFMVLL